MNTPTTETDYERDAEGKLKACGGRLTIKLSDSKAAPWENNNRYRPHYRCELRGPGGAYAFDFWGSISAGETGTRASIYEVLACLTWYTPEDFKEFCSEYGYGNDSIQAHKTWRACLAQTRALKRVFPLAEHRELLQEIR